MLEIHRSTAVRAYAELRALGYLESRPGSYTTVRRRRRPPATRAPASAAGSAVDWHEACAPPAGDAVDGDGDWPEWDQTRVAGADLIDFERLAADPRLSPADDLRSALAATLRRERGAALDYADPRGWPPLRELIAQRLAQHGVRTSSAEILVTSGAQHGLDLVLRLLAQPGDRIAVESPTYGMAHALFRLHGLRPLELPLTLDGMDLERLERSLRRDRPRLVYTIPTFHNPTGLTTGQAHRERLLALCERARIPIVEDGFEEEMKYFGRAVLPIKSMDARGVVLYLGTLSKVVFPGLRVGWIAGPGAAIERLARLHYGTCLSGNTLAQAAAARYARGARYEAHLRRVHRVYRARMQAMLDGLAENLPSSASWTRPRGGYTLWLDLPRGRSEAEWVERMRGAGVSVAPGSRFYARPSAAPHARLSIACASEERIVEGCRRLGRAFS